MEQVPRALLSHCWQRAVHAASTTIPLAAVKEPKYEVRQPTQNYSTPKGITKCDSSRLSFPTAGEQQVCPSCKVVYDEEDQLRRHYFGTPNQLGCCWRLIDDKNHELLDEALQNEVKATVSQLFDLLGKQIYRRGSRSTALCWREVIGILSAVVAQSKQVARDEPVIEALQLDGGH